MDASRFDRLARVCAAFTSRRGLLTVLTALPLAGSLSALTEDETDAAGRRKRRKKRHKHGQGNAGRRKGKKKVHCAKAGQTRKPGKRCCKGLTEDSSGQCVRPANCTPITCSANACGVQPDGCGGTLQCGGCGTNQLCVDAVCRACDVCPTAGACAFTTVEAAIGFNAPPLQTIVVCPGEYTGDLNIDRNLTLIGAGEGGNPSVDTILQGTGTTTVMTIANASQEVTLRNLRITGGSSGSGGGINHAGRLLTMTACTVIDNEIDGNTFSSFGAGILNNDGSTANLTDCTISDNDCTGDAGGGGIANFGKMTLTDCLVSGNTTTGDSSNGGGGLSNFASGDLTLDRTIVRQNHANSGAGILNSVGTLRAMNCSITGNTTAPATVAGRGAGIYSFGDGTLLDACSVTENIAPDSSIPGVYFSEGGGLYNDAGTVTLANGTSIVNNQAQLGANCGGGGITLGEGCAP